MGIKSPETSTSGVVTDTTTYNAYGELASYEAFASGTPIFSEIADTAGAPRDELGRIVERTETNGGATVTYSYDYDLQGRLIEVYADGTISQSYTYDDNGNRLSLDTPSGSVTATYDDQDRLLTYGTFAYTYTDNGELLSKTDTSTSDVTLYEFDVFGNLVRVDLPDGTVIEYLVDGQNRRVGKAVDGVLVKQWLWADQLRIAAELDGAGNLVSRFVYGDKATTPELVIQGSAVYRVISDHLGSVRALVNIADAQDVPVRLEYEAFGSVSGTGVGVVPQGFAGGLYDADTGLVRFGARDYDAVVGRWAAKDPSNFRGRSANLYAYAENDAVNSVDRTGEMSTEQFCEELAGRDRRWCEFECDAVENSFVDDVCELLGVERVTQKEQCGYDCEIKVLRLHTQCLRGEGDGWEDSSGCPPGTRCASAQPRSR